MKSIAVYLMIAFSMVSASGWAQSESEYEWGAVFNLSAGLTGYHYSGMEKNLGNTDPTGERWSQGSFELGAEAYLVLKKHLLIRVNYFDTWSYGFSVADFRGKWHARGNSIGLGYGSVDEATAFYIFPSISFGLSNGDLELNATSDTFFGDEQVGQGVIQDLKIANAFLDLNIHFGKMLKIGSTDRTFGLTPAISMGYKMSVNRGTWREAERENEVNGVTGSLLYGWYIKFGIGLGGFWN